MARYIRVKLAMAEGNPETIVRALSPSAGSVLATHRKIVSQFATPSERARAPWVITHAPTGRGVGFVFPKRAQALELCAEFGERAEWQAIGPRGGVEKLCRDFVQEFNAAARRTAGVE